jgi:hypothetical protein
VTPRHGSPASPALRQGNPAIRRCVSRLAPHAGRGGGLRGLGILRDRDPARGVAGRRTARRPPRRGVETRAHPPARGRRGPARPAPARAAAGGPGPERATPQRRGDDPPASALHRRDAGDRPAPHRDAGPARDPRADTRPHPGDLRRELLGLLPHGQGRARGRGLPRRERVRRGPSREARRRHRGLDRGEAAPAHAPGRAARERPSRSRS